MIGWLWWIPFGRVDEIAPGELAERLAEPTPEAGSVAVRRPQILDVRTRAEYRRGHIPGAVNLPVQELAQGLEQLGLEPSRPVVAVCLSAHRSVPAVRLLQRRGFEDAVQLQGGMMAWRRARLALVTETASSDPP